MNRAQFEEYVGHFNNKRYDALVGYFSPDVTVEFFTPFSDPKVPAKTLHGAQEFVANYKRLHESMIEVLELRDFLAAGNLMAVELYTEFHCLKDYRELISGPVKEGDAVIMTNWVIYNMDANDKMKRIRIAHFRMHDPKEAKFAPRRQYPSS